jgi:predicted HAD superfamily hydrolase
MKRNKITHSFDVFDTCLIRTCGEPIAVFHLVAYELYGHDADETLIFDFVNARIRAEKTALETLTSMIKEDVSIDEIYFHIDHNIRDYFGIDNLIKTELKIERDVLRPNLTIRIQIDNLRKDGNVIVFISDMYLPSDFIKNQLIINGFWINGDKLYVSSEIRLTKRKGSLFNYIASSLNINFKEWNHYGDNLHSDYKIPTSKGIKSTLIINAEYSRYQLEWLNNFSLESMLMAGISRSVRLSKEISVANGIITDVIAPLFVPFVSWVMEDARKRGIKKLFFLARDGYIFYTIAQTFKLKYPEIELSYLYGSRRAFYLPGLDQGTKEEFNWIMGGAHGRTPRQMMARINLNIDIITLTNQFNNGSPNFFDKKMDVGGFELFLELLTDKNNLDKILTESKIQKDLVIKYFIQEGLFDLNSNVAIVDLGWSKTCQKSINAIIEKQNVFGYYFGVFKNRHSVEQAGNYKAGFYPEGIFSNELLNVLTGPFVPIVEHVFALCNHGSTIGYKLVNDKILPVFDKIENESSEALIYLNELNESIKLYSDEFLKNPLLLKESRLLISKYGFSSLKTLMKKPERRESIFFNSFVVGNNLNDNESIVKPFPLINFFKSKLFNDCKRPKIFWFEGSIVYSYGKIGLLFFELLSHLKKSLK